MYRGRVRFKADQSAECEIHSGCSFIKELWEVGGGKMKKGGIND